jgi:hypothetical protein
MFCSPELIFGGIDGVRSRLHVLRSWTSFRRCRMPRVPFSYFAHPDSFSTIQRPSGLYFMFCVPELIFGGTKDVGSRFNVLCTQIHFRRYRWRRVPFSAVPRASGPNFMFSAPRLIFGGTDCVKFRFHVLRARARFRRYLGHLVSISCFALPDSFSAVQWASIPVFTFCAPRFIFGGTDGIRSRFLILRSQTYFRQFRGRRVPFISFAHPYLFSAVPRASGLVFMFCAPGHVFDGAECVRSCFHVLCARTRFRRSRLHVFGVGIIFWR